MRTETVATKWGSDRYMLMTAGEIPGVVEKHNISGGGGWYGETREGFERHVRLGDESLVEESDKFLSRIEDLVPQSRGWRTIDDVAGSVPNVPALLAGHPLAMRRRQRVDRDNSPLAIYMDLTSSGGIGSSDVQRRGVALLALTRLLVSHRAVTLWVGASLGKYGVSGTVAWQIDTAPLDLARSSYHVAATSMSRLFGYTLNRSVLGTGGSWPFNNYELHCRTARERLMPMLGAGELLYVPPIVLHDALTKDPVGWVRRTMAEYTGHE